MLAGNYQLKVFFGHHKCASEWIIQILLRISGYMGLKSHYLKNNFDEEYYKTVNTEIRSNKVSLVLSQSSNMRKAGYLDNYKGFHVIRDPRDICISGYYSHLYSHNVDEWPELYDLRQRLKQTSKNEGLFLEMEFLKEFFTDMNDWDYSQPNILEIKLEDLTYAPNEIFLQIFTFLGMISGKNLSSIKELLRNAAWLINVGNRRYPNMVPFRFEHNTIHPRKLDQIINHFNFKKLAQGRKQGETDVTSHYRKGQPADWVNHFNEDHKTYFKDNYGTLLIKLGYESSMDW